MSFLLLCTILGLGGVETISRNPLLDLLGKQNSLPLKASNRPFVDIYRPTIDIETPVLVSIEQQLGFIEWFSNVVIQDRKDYEDLARPTSESNGGYIYSAEFHLDHDEEEENDLPELKNSQTARQIAKRVLGFEYLDERKAEAELGLVNYQSVSSEGRSNFKSKLTLMEYYKAVRIVKEDTRRWPSEQVDKLYDLLNDNCRLLQRNIQTMRTAEVFPPLLSNYYHKALAWAIKRETGQLSKVSREEKLRSKLEWFKRYVKDVGTLPLPDDYLWSLSADLIVAELRKDGGIPPEAISDKASFRANGYQSATFSLFLHERCIWKYLPPIEVIEPLLETDSPELRAAIEELNYREKRSQSDYVQGGWLPGEEPRLLSKVFQDSLHRYLVAYADRDLKLWIKFFGIPVEQILSFGVHLAVRLRADYASVEVVHPSTGHRYNRIYPVLYVSMMPLFLKPQSARRVVQELRKLVTDIAGKRYDNDITKVQLSDLKLAHLSLHTDTASAQATPWEAVTIMSESALEFKSPSASDSNLAFVRYAKTFLKSIQKSLDTASHTLRFDKRPFEPISALEVKDGQFKQPLPSPVGFEVSSDSNTNDVPPPYCRSDSPNVNPLKLSISRICFATPYGPDEATNEEKFVLNFLGYYPIRTIVPAEYRPNDNELKHGTWVCTEDGWKITVGSDLMRDMDQCESHLRRSWTETSRAKWLQKDFEQSPIHAEQSLREYNSMFDTDYAGLGLSKAYAF